jgi:ferric-dicitrate binding protein FerR (iron transport regulator)
MDYSDYSVEDLIKDESFQQWVLSPDINNSAFWTSFQNQYPDKGHDILKAAEFIRQLHFKETDNFETRITSLKNRIRSRIDDVSVLSSVNEPGNSNVKPLRRLNIYAIAATVSIVVVIAFLVVGNKAGFSDLLKTDKRTEATEKGQRNLIVLQDGTSVWLNAQSKLQYPKTFENDNMREVYLEGEAFFDVVKNSKKPFVVHTSDLSVKVLGTSFNVKSYSEDSNIETTLVHGIISISTDVSKEENIRLKPNQQAIFNKKSKKIILENKIETADFTGWKKGMLVFDNMPFSEIKTSLERWYNITIHLEDKASLKCSFSARFDNETIEEVLDLFKTSEAITYTIQDHDVYVYGKLCGD